MHRDIAIIGGGVAGLQLAMKLAEDQYFADQEILIIDPDGKSTNDKTFCFWEKGSGQWDDIVCKQWSSGKFYSSHSAIDLKMKGYTYKMVQSSDFYAFAKRKLGQYSNVKWLKTSVTRVQGHYVITPEVNILVGEIFDSRVSESFWQERTDSIDLIQHFKGWKITTPEDTFAPDEFTMMDFRIRHVDATAFNYVLPLTTKSALVEYTFFSSALVSEKEYDQMLKRYIEDILGIKSYQIEEVEVGKIPMSNFHFEQDNRDFYTRIGTGGGWVKPSTGYSFLRTNRFVDQIIYNLKNNKRASHKLFKSRFGVYDTMLLDQLNQFNADGEYLFDRMYRKVSARLIFKFLDEQTNWLQELRIMSAFSPIPFIRSFFKWYVFKEKG